MNLIIYINPTWGGGGFKSPPWGKIAFLVHFCDPIEPKKFDFSQNSMGMPLILFWGLKTAKKTIYDIVQIHHMMDQVQVLEGC